MTPKYFTKATLAAAALLALACALPSHAATSTATAATDLDAYEFRAPEAETGSAIRPVIGYASMPMTRAYGDWSAEERAALRAAMPDLAANDQPPVPEQALKAVVKAINDLRPGLAMQEKMALRLAVEPDGSVKSLKVISASNADLVKAVALALSSVHFAPGTHNGAVVPMELPLQIEAFGSARSSVAVFQFNSRVPLQAGNAEQPQNAAPAAVPRVATR